MLRRVLREELDVHSAFTMEKFMREGLDAHFNCRYALEVDLVEKVGRATDFWKQVKIGAEYEGYIVCPEGYRRVVLYTKEAFSYPFMAVRDITLPDLAGYPSGTSVWMGFEDGGFGSIAAFQLTTPDGVATNFYAYIGMAKYWRRVDITGLLPVDWATAVHLYSVEVAENMAVFSCDGKPMAFGLLTPHSYITPISGPPYAVFSCDTRIPARITSFVEVAGVGKELKLNLAPTHLRISRGARIPPRIFKLYVAGTETEFAGYTLTSGTLESHPIPAFGYAGKTIFFQADQSGTLAVEALTQTGSWRKYLEDAVAAGEFWWLKVTGNSLLLRLLYTPDAYPAAVAEGEVQLGA